MSQGIDLPVDDALLSEVTGLIERARTRAAVAVNSELVMLYWSIGKRIREDVLGGERAGYGQVVVQRLANALTRRYGAGYGKSNLLRMVQFADLYQHESIVAPVARQLTWTNVTILLTIPDQQKRDFYLLSAAHERWSKRTLRSRINGKLYERTIAARGSVVGLQDELAAPRETGSARGLAFRDPYVLDFLGLPPQQCEADLERAILNEMQQFLLELGSGFAFVARQKRIIVDGEDFYLDLLFYHYRMRCFVAVELKTRKLEPGDYGQMTLYLRWLDAHERGPGDEAPVGLILCTDKGPQQAALLGLDEGEIRAARYITEPIREELSRRLTATVQELREASGR
ncbi:MAG: hypothetical protein FD171_1989 [Actinobacteria bacterium]|nr:MAG: hypothetical protein FD171_1989 [Actinomycetota bacterium]